MDLDCLVLFVLVWYSVGCVFGVFCRKICLLSDLFEI